MSSVSARLRGPHVAFAGGCNCQLEVLVCEGVEVSGRHVKVRGQLLGVERFAAVYFNILYDFSDTGINV